MTPEERIWWAVLLDADTQSEIYARHGNGESGIRATQVGNQVRKTLVEKFGVNLDEICQEARDVYRRLYHERLVEDEAEKQRRIDTKKAADLARELLKR